MLTQCISKTKHKRKKKSRHKQQQIITKKSMEKQVWNNGFLTFSWNYTSFCMILFQWEVGSKQKVQQSEKTYDQILSFLRGFDKRHLSADLNDRDGV